MGLFDTQKLPTNKVFIATIIECLPTIGHAVVLPASNTVLMDAAPVVATLPFADARMGATDLPMYSAGTTVLCFSSRVGGEYMVHIICSLNMNLDPREVLANATKPYNAEEWMQASKSAHSQWSLLEKLCPNGEHTWARTRSHGAAGDALPGDYDIFDKTGYNGLHIGRMLSQLKGSAMSFIDAGTMTNGVRRVGDELEDHTLTHESVITDGYAVNNTAISLSEAFGLLDGRPACKIMTNENKLKLTDETALPFYRLQHMSGMTINGEEDVVLAPRSKSKRHDKDNEPYVLARRRVGLDGALSSASALSIASVKSPVILAAMQARYATNDSVDSETAEGTTSQQDDLREPYKETQKETKEFQEQRAKADKTSNDRRVDDAALNKLIDTLLEGDYRQVVLNIMAKKGFSRASKAASVNADIKDAKNIGGMTQKMEYGLPDTLTLTDPVTGEEKTYYASMSFISQEPDGSICLCDGYGSEIRMSRGNIYISPALDCLVRPGRDMSVMAGRHQAYNSQQTCTINSTTSMYIRAVKDMLIAGATGKKGKLVLECDNEAHNSSSGMVVKSKSDMSVTAARNIYMGINKAQNMTEGGVAGGAGGGIILDALNGMTYIKGTNVTVDAGEFVACANNIKDNANNTVALSDYPELSTKPRDEMTKEEQEEYDKAKQLIDDIDAQSGTALIVSTRGVEMDSDIVNVTGNLALTSSGKKTISVYRGKSDKKVRLRTVKTPGIGCAGDIHSDSTVSAYVTVTAPFGAFGNGTWRVRGSGHHCSYWIEFDSVEGMKADFPDQIQPDSSSISSNMKDAHKGAYQDAYITKNAFSFPETYSVDASAVMPGMVWQDVAKLSTTVGDMWQETWIAAPGNAARTACYPGYAVWNKQELSVRGYDTTSLKSGYIVNAKLTGADKPDNIIS